MKALRAIVMIMAMMVSISSFAQFTTGRNRTSSYNSELSIPSGYKGFVDLGYGIGTGDFKAGRIEFSTTHGCQFAPYFFAGVGAGVNYFHDESSVNIPIFADFRGSLPIQNTKVAPFLDMRIGYSILDVDGFYFSPSIGIRIATSEKCGFNIGLGYELQKTKVDYYYWEESATVGAITIKLGYDF